MNGESIGTIEYLQVYESTRRARICIVVRVKLGRFRAREGASLNIRCCGAPMTLLENPHNLAWQYQTHFIDMGAPTVDPSGERVGSEPPPASLTTASDQTKWEY